VSAGKGCSVEHLQITISPALLSGPPQEACVRLKVERVQGKAMHIPSMLSGRVKENWHVRGSGHHEKLNADGTWAGMQEDEENRELVRNVNMALHGWFCRLLPSLTYVPCLMLSKQCCRSHCWAPHVRITTSRQPLVL
jgi:hypothetical protein